MSALLEERALEIVAPRYRYVPDTRVGDFGDEIVDMMGLMGRQLDPTQAMAVADLSAYDKRGRWVSLEAGVVEARQNGKTGAVLLPVALFDLFHLPPDRICWTAHRFKTARGTYEDVTRLLDTAPEYARRVLRVNRSHGEEGFYLKNGASLEFLARENGGSGRGLGGKRNVFDEALILKGPVVGSLMPTMSARKLARIDYGSSAALAGDDSNHLRTLVRRGRYAVSPDRFVWLEWCAPGGWGTNPCDERDDCPHDGRRGCRYPMCELGKDCPHTLTSPGCALDNREYIKMANHTAGDRITWQYIEDERVGLAALPREHGRERLGWHEEPPEAGSESGVDMKAFNGLENTRLLPPGTYDQMAVVVDMPPDRSEANVWVAWKATDPKTQEQRPAVMGHAVAVKDVVTFLAGRQDKDGYVDPDHPGLLAQADLVELAIMGSGPAGSLIKPLNKRGADAFPAWEVKSLSFQEASQAVGHWIDAVRNKTFWHLGQETLRNAQRDATLRKYSDGALLWVRENPEALGVDASPGGSSISPLYGATLALHRLYTEGDNGGPNIW